MDIIVAEQFIGFVQYHNSGLQNVEVRFLFTGDALYLNDSAKSQALYDKSTNSFRASNKENLTGLCTDGASVMVGKREGLTSKLRRDLTPEGISHSLRDISTSGRDEDISNEETSERDGDNGCDNLYSEKDNTSSNNPEGPSIFDLDLIMRETTFVSPAPSNDHLLIMLRENNLNWFAFVELKMLLQLYGRSS